MARKQIEITPEALAALTEAARAGAFEGSIKAGCGSFTNYFRAMELLLMNYRKLAELVADEEAYCAVEYHAGRTTFAASPQPTGYAAHRTEEEIIEEMREDRRRHFQETRYGFERLKRAVDLFKHQQEFAAIRLYYLGEDADGYPREGGPLTWEDVADILGRDEKTVRRWRNRLVNDMAVCVYGIPAAASAATYRGRSISGA